MVSYTKWVSILFEVYPDAEATQVIQVAAQHWSERKADIKAATVAEARQYAQSNC